MQDILFSILDEDIYTRHYDVDSPAVSDKPIHIITECTKNPDPQISDDHFKLDIYFSVGNYGTRDHLIGVFFGYQGMTKAEIDETILDLVKSQFEDLNFGEVISGYLKKEELYENWCVERNSSATTASDE